MDFDMYTHTQGKILTSREKYNLILPSMLNIASLAAYHGTEYFTNSLYDMKTVESMVRSGMSLEKMVKIVKYVPHNVSLVCH